MTKGEEWIEREGKLALGNKVKSEKHLGIWGVKRRERNENVFARPSRLREYAEAALSCRGPGPARQKKEVYH